jgi:Uma2 family endonuclease
MIQEASVQGPPDRVIEGLAPRTARRDRTLKWQLYQRYEVPHSWLIDPQSRQAVAYRLEGGEYVPAAQVQGQEAFSAPPFPDPGPPSGRPLGLRAGR